MSKVSLDEVIVGSKIKFNEAEDGTVIEIWSKVGFDSPITINGLYHSVAASRLRIEHEDGSESYHTYRYDGVSHASHTHDITHIRNEL